MVKSNLFVGFLEELRIPKSHFEIKWPLVCKKKKEKEDLQIICSFLFALEGDQTDEDLEDIDPEDPEMNDEESDLLLKFSRMRLKVKIINS